MTLLAPKHFLSSRKSLPNVYFQRKEQGLQAMRRKARGLIQHGGPPGRLEESDQAGVILHVMDRPYRLPFPYRLP
jgi:hypothetical protein